MLRSLVGSEMCIRDRCLAVPDRPPASHWSKREVPEPRTPTWALGSSGPERNRLGHCWGREWPWVTTGQSRLGTVYPRSVCHLWGHFSFQAVGRAEQEKDRTLARRPNLGSISADSCGDRHLTEVSASFLERHPYPVSLVTASERCDGIVPLVSEGSLLRHSRG